MDARAVVLFGILGLGIITCGAVGGTNIVDLDGDEQPVIAELQTGTAPFDGDTDGDGIGDGEENALGTDPTDPDSDDDGVTDGEERERGTDPRTEDSDNDGLDDGEEHERETDPLDTDTDDDGLDDSDEGEYGTDPLVADTDEDGVNDSEEVVDHGTDPTDEDTDDDDLVDGDEIRDHATDPTDPDTDSDGFADGAEITQFRTNPTDDDTDGDGVRDGIEVNRHETNPSVGDTDGDGLDDATEVRSSDTDPTTPDTDGDRLADGAEIDVGTDPTAWDTDGDGLPDGPEVTDDDRYPDADPLAVDIYVEIDEVSGQSISDHELEEIEEEFADAPIENVDGSNGIALHLEQSDDVGTYHETSWEEYDDIRADHFDTNGYGYHYMVIVSEIDADREVPDGKILLGQAVRGEMMVRDHNRVDTGSTAMHELGHSLGLSSAEHDGIDSEEYSMYDYPSVMNYNAALDYYGFSDGTSGENDFDDWGHIRTNLYTPDTSAV